MKLYRVVWSFTEQGTGMPKSVTLASNVDIGGAMASVYAHHQTTVDTEQGTGPNVSFGTVTVESV
jgi:hypothetical protein